MCQINIQWWRVKLHCGLTKFRLSWNSYFHPCYYTPCVYSHHSTCIILVSYHLIFLTTEYSLYTFEQASVSLAPLMQCEQSFTCGEWCKWWPCAVVMGQISAGYIQRVNVQSKSFFRMNYMCQEIFISHITSLCTKRVWIRVKRFLSKKKTCK